MATQMGKFGLVFEQVTGSAPGHSADSVQLYASSSTNEAGTTKLFMKDSAGTEIPLGGSFKLEDGDGTELAISGGAQLKFAEGGAIDINWTDVSDGIDGDEYDLTFTLDIQNLGASTTVDDADLVVIDDGANGTLRKMTRAHFIESAALDNINIDGGAIDGTPIGANSAAAGTFAALVATSAVVNGNSALSGTLHVTGNSQLQGTLEQKGAASFEAAITAQNNLTVGGQTDLNGDVNLGDASSDTVTVTGQFDSDLVPSTDNARDLGSSAKQWKDLYVNGAAHIDALGQHLDAGDFNISNLNALTASAIQVNQLDVVTINSVTQSDLTLEVQDKLIVSALSASSANSDGGGLRIGGGSTVVGHAAVLWNHASSSLDFSIGDESQLLVKDGSVVPSRDDNVDLGASGAEFKDLYIDGVAYVDSLQADQLGAALDANNQAITNINVDSGAIDGVTLGGNALVTATNIDINSGSLDAVQIGYDSPSSAKFTSISGSGNAEVGGTLSVDGAVDFDARLVVSGGVECNSVLHVRDSASFSGSVQLGDATSDLITATGRFDSSLVPNLDSTHDLGTSALQWSAAHIDVGHIDQLGAALDANNQAITNINVDGGAIDGTVIGANSAAAGTFAAIVGTSAVINGNAAVSGTLHVTGNSQLQGTLEQKGAASFEAAITAQDNLSVSGVATMSGHLTASAGMSVADALVPASDSAVDLGRSGAAFKMLFVDDIDLNGQGRIDLDADGDTSIRSAADDQIQLEVGGADMVSVLATGVGINGGYGSGNGISLGADGTVNADSNLNLGANGSGASIIAYGATANERFMYDNTNHKISFRSGSAGTMLTIGGNATTDFALDVADGAHNLNKVRAAAFVTYSDESLKEDVASMSNTALDTVMSLEGVEFTWKNSGERDFGFIAQDVQKVVPKAVHTASDGVQGVDYSRLTSILVEAVKSQQVQIEELKNTISKLKK